jgi:hypothetical protein
MRNFVGAAVQPRKALGRVQLKGNLVVIVIILDCVDHVSFPATATDTAVASTSFSYSYSSCSVGVVYAAGHNGRGHRWRRTEAAVDAVLDSLAVAHKRDCSLATVTAHSLAHLIEERPALYKPGRNTTAAILFTCGSGKVENGCIAHIPRWC